MAPKDNFRIPPEVRDKGLEILYSDLPESEKCRLLEVLLRPADWDLGRSYPWRRIARDLEIPLPKVRYQLSKSHFREDDRHHRSSVRHAKTLAGAEVTSQKLGFGLWLPKDWEVRDDTDEYDAEWVENENGEVAATVSGFWNATDETGTTDIHGELFAEVSKLRLNEPLTSLDLYRRMATRSPTLETKSRSRYPLRVAGMEAIRYTARLRRLPNDPTRAVCAIYLSDGTTGWEVSLWGENKGPPEAFVISYGYQKALFSSRIAPSFRTLI